METNDLLLSLKQEIEDLKKVVLDFTNRNPLFEKWLTRKELMTFMHYGATQMAAFEKTSGIITTRVGKRKFFLRASLEKFLEKNIQKA